MCRKISAPKHMSTERWLQKAMGLYFRKPMEVGPEHETEERASTGIGCRFLSGFGRRVTSGVLRSFGGLAVVLQLADAQKKNNIV